MHNSLIKLHSIQLFYFFFCTVVCFQMEQRQNKKQKENFRAGTKSCANIQVSRLVPLWFTSHLRHRNSSHPVFPVPARSDNSNASLVPVFFFRVDSRWMIDGAVSSCFPLMFGIWIIPELSVAVLGGFCSNLVCFCHTAMKDSLLVLA